VSTIDRVPRRRRRRRLVHSSVCTVVVTGFQLLPLVFLEQAANIVSPSARRHLLHFREDWVEYGPKSWEVPLK